MENKQVSYQSILKTNLVKIWKNPGMNNFVSNVY